MNNMDPDTFEERKRILIILFLKAYLKAKR